MNAVVVNYCKSKGFQLGAALGVTLVIYIALLATHREDYYFYILGGVIGGASALIVLIDNIRHKKDKEPYPLLFWRAFCDLGLAVRFLAIPGFNLLLCNHLVCTRSDSDEQNCSFPSAMFEFFSIASEAWFLCNGLDLYYSVTNPFSSYKKRMRGYHFFVWTAALLFSVLPLLSRHKKRIYGFWYVSSKIDTSAVCWIKVNANSLSPAMWVLFFVPLLVIYTTCTCSLLVAYIKLRRGITRTFLPRMKLLVTNTANVIVLILYWFCLVLIYSWAFFTRYNPTYNTYLNNVLSFILASKGFSCLIVWILISDKTFKAGDQTIDANKSLREEVLNFATAGIRSSARAGPSFNKDRHAVTRVPQQAVNRDTKTKITPSFFLRFILGQHEEVAEVEKMVSTKRRSVHENFKRTEILMTEKNDEIELLTRLSQRPTMVSGAKAVRESAVRESSLDRESETQQERSFQSEVSAENSRPSEMIETDSEAGESAYSQALKIPKGENIFSYFFNSLKSYILDSTEAVEFTEFEPYYYRQIRLSAGVTDELYIDYFSTTIKERLTQGGASGAFFFFSKGEKFIAKSCTETEMESLRSCAERYSSYMTKNRDSFISKIFGAYRLKIYGNYLNFFVMNNLFLNSEGLSMHEKYDIKGSWVSRNAEPPSNGQSVTCTHCEQKYTYIKYKKNKKNAKKTRMNSLNLDTPSDSRAVLELVDTESGKDIATLNPMKRAADDSVDTESGISAVTEDLEKERQYCPYTVDGEHEPNLILKDNDLKYKIKLPLQTAVHFIRQMQMDAEYLLSEGVCDYSLLVGVHNTEYEVQQSADGEKRSVKKLSGDEDFIQDRLSRSPPPSNGHNRASDGSDGSVELSATRKLEVLRVVGPDAYFMGIIDYQQKWTLKKKLERFFKVNFKGADPDGLSAINPEVYKERFLRKIEDILDLENLNRTASYAQHQG